MKWTNSLGAGSFLPLFFSPLQGRDARASGVLCLLWRRLSLPKRWGPSPLPGEGGTGWVDRQRCRRLVLRSFYPSPRDDLPSVGLFSPLSRGETRGQASCFVQGEGASPSRNGRPRVPSPEGEGQEEGMGWVTGHPSRIIGYWRWNTRRLETASDQCTLINVSSSVFMKAVLLVSSPHRPLAPPIGSPPATRTTPRAPPPRFPVSPPPRLPNHPSLR